MVGASSIRMLWGLKVASKRWGFITAPLGSQYIVGLRSIRPIQFRSRYVRLGQVRSHSVYDMMPRHVTTRYVRHVTSRHVTSRHVTSRHVTSHHVKTLHVTSCHTASYPAGRISCHTTLHQVALRNKARQDKTRFQLTSHHFISCHFALYCNALHSIECQQAGKSHHVMSHLVISNEIRSRRTMSCHVVSYQAPSCLLRIHSNIAIQIKDRTGVHKNWSDKAKWSPWEGGREGVEFMRTVTKTTFSGDKLSVCLSVYA